MRKHVALALAGLAGVVVVVLLRGGMRAPAGAVAREREQEREQGVVARAALEAADATGARRALAPVEGEEAAAPQAAELPTCAVTIEDEHARPIPGAWLVVGERRVRAGDDGVAILPWDAEHDVDRVMAFAGAERFVRRTFSIAVGAESARVALTARSPLRGRVVLPDGSPAPAGLAVLHWPVIARSPDLSLFLEKAGSEPFTLEHALTDALGEFVLDEVAAGVRYGAVAGGLGFVSQKMTGFLADDPELVLVVQHAYAACIEPSAGGRPLTVEDIAHGGWQASWSCRSPSPEAQIARLMSAHFGELAFLGLPTDRCPEPARRVVFVGDPGRDGDPCSVRMRLPGHDDARVEFSPEPVARGLTHVHVDLQPSTGVHGVLELVFSGLSPDMARAYRTLLKLGSLSPWGELLLADVARNEVATYQVRFEDLEGLTTVTGIPVGRYRWKLQLLDGKVRAMSSWQAPEVLEVRSDAPGRIEVDLKGRGGVEVVLRRGGEPFEGAVWLHLATGPPVVLPGGEKQLEDVSIERCEVPPYLFPALRPGEYTLFVNSPGWPERGESAYVPVHVESGRIATVTVDLD